MGVKIEDTYYVRSASTAADIGWAVYFLRIAIGGALVLLVIFPSMIARADGEALIFADANTSVAEHAPDEPRSARVSHVLSAGLGRGRVLGRSVTYLRFRLDALPLPTPFIETPVAKAQLSLMVTSFGLAKIDQSFLVFVGSCDTTDWDEGALTWQDRPCSEEATGEASLIVDGTTLPKTYEWNVSRAVARALERHAGEVTFVIDAVRLQKQCARDPFEGIGCVIEEDDRIGTVRFASRERNKYGVGAVPQLVVRYSSKPTSLMRIVEITLSVMSAFLLTFGVYKTIRGVVRGSTPIDR